jgi:hypothetical protein
MLTLVIALIFCLGVIVASVLNHRAVTAAARITAADPVRFDAALIQALTDMEVAPAARHGDRGRPHPGHRRD